MTSGFNCIICSTIGPQIPRVLLGPGCHPAGLHALLQRSHRGVSWRTNEGSLAAVRHGPRCDDLVLSVGCHGPTLTPMVYCC